MRRAAIQATLAAGAAVAVSAIAWPAYGRAAFFGCLEILVPLGACTAVIAEVIANHPRLVAGVRRRLGALAVLVAAQLVAAVALFASLMFVSPHDAFFMALAAGYAGLIGLGAARLVARRALGDLEAVRTALAEVGEGSRTVHVHVEGEDEIASLAADVESMAAKLEAEERTRRQLVASVSHDLRTPITNMRLITEGLEDGIFEPDHSREQLRLISAQVRALGSLIDDLFELSRLEAGDIRWSMQQVRLDELVRETIETMRPQAREGGITVHAELAHELRPAQGNPEQLQRVLFNLIQNAIRHTPADGSVVVRAWPAADRGLEVEVADSGGGIDPLARERLFEPFVQGPSRAGGQIGSAGLGLAIARAIVHAHGGEIWVASGGPGTQMRFSLPVAR
ncbi:MAG: HAMP domain-containing histidine kinase [Solirubrobacterales bacterium]|nr:HAMP domain-containing histidine kinase [Solirubrobacterales bacterium]